MLALVAAGVVCVVAALYVPAFDDGTEGSLLLGGLLSVYLAVSYRTPMREASHD